VIDIGCGIGSDSMGCARAGLGVVAVDVDPVTASVAQAKLAGRAEVICADASGVAEKLITPGVGVFCDPPDAMIAGGCGVWRTLHLRGPLSCVCSTACKRQASSWVRHCHIR
jgi:hypothetical protein